MAGYILLTKFTPKGIAEVKGSPERVKRIKDAAKQMGGKVVGCWWTLGEYDMVMVVDATNDQTLATAVLSTLKEGYVTTTTMRAFSEDEFAQVVSKLP